VFLSLVQQARGAGEGREIMRDSTAKAAAMD
jgi:hypothetical protein